MRFSKRAKGSITVFLLITFTTTFVLAGALVDGARVKMAKSLAESSLDTAASSALSYYDELLYDMYGLFAMGNADQGAIEKRMEQYFEDTLSLVPGDHSGLKASLNKSISEGYFDPYAFQIESMNTGSGLNLGQVYVTESQIIEHMKYRAPLQLIDEDFGFLQNVNGIIKMKDRLSAAKAKNDVTNQYKSTIKSGGKLINDINEFGNTCKAFVKAPFPNGVSMDQFLTTYDNDMAALYKEYSELVKKQNKKSKPDSTNNSTGTSSNNGSNGSTDSTDNSTSSESSGSQENYSSKMQEVLKKIAARELQFNQDWDAFETRMNKLYEKDLSLKKQTDDYISGMNQYIASLKSKMNSGGEDYKTVFGPEIELSKATVGKVIVNKGVLLQLEMNLNIRKTTDKKNLFYNKISEVLDKKLEKADTSKGTDTWGSGYLSTRIQNMQYCKDMYEKLSLSGEAASDFTENSANTKLETYKPDRKKVDQIQEDAKTKSGMQSIDPNLIVGAVDGGKQYGANSSSSDDAYGSGDDASDKAFDQGINLLGDISRLLEQSRDTLYINEYILANFRNYVHHSAMDPKDSGAQKTEKEYDSIIAERSTVYGGRSRVYSGRQFESICQCRICQQ